MNTIYKSLILGGMGAIVIILSYLVALSEIELSIDIPAMVAPTSISEKRVAPDKKDNQLAEEIGTSSPMITKIKNEFLACTESTETTLTHVAPHPFFDPVKAEMTSNLRIKGFDEAGFCHIDQEIVKTTMFLYPEDRQIAILEDGTTEADIEKFLGEMNEEYIGMPVVVSDCYGTAENLFAYFQALETGKEIGNISSSFSTNDGSINIMEDYQVTCLTPLVFAEEDEEEASSTEEVILEPEN